MADLDELLRSDIAGAAAEAVDHPDFASIERRGVRRRRVRLVLTGVAAAGVVVLVGLGAVRILDDGTHDRVTPIRPAPSVTTSPTSSTGWPGSLRDGAALPLVTSDKRGDAGEIAWRDQRDASYGGVDIRQVLFSDKSPDGAAWWVLLRQAPPLPSKRHPASRVVEYGIVVDADGDRVADCQIGINDDVRKAGDYRVWVKDLETGEIDERVGGPYGIPIDFAHPNEEDGGLRAPRTMSFFFLGRSTAPCAFDDNGSFYTWASVGDGQHVRAWDFAPDNAWLRMR